MQKGNHDHDRTLRFVGLLRSLRQKQLLPGRTRRVDDGTINALVAAECYIADIPGSFEDTSLTVDGICFVNLLWCVAPIDWNCERAPIVGRGNGRRGDPIGDAIKKNGDKERRGTSYAP